ncbi:hypothetical protein MEG_00863 [Bartonella tamiae Th307]|uniref:Uncharacterized protein n=1 Tax=Bartonella tamiae Th239 TaxID=1094558 RepID=J0ZPT9_9HYPH|nr:hypothetical protein ME5_01019 [Bartonella tamiae Th239]EJF94005.1 hypothetical protein MEG_00863 [Bartonella tamiae Th307]
MAGSNKPKSRKKTKIVLFKKFILEENHHFKKLILKLLFTAIQKAL